VVQSTARENGVVYGGCNVVGKEVVVPSVDAWRKGVRTGMGAIGATPKQWALDQKSPRHH
jgi:hypothetical protein